MRRTASDCTKLTFTAGFYLGCFLLMACAGGVEASDAKPRRGKVQAAEARGVVSVSDLPEAAESLNSPAPTRPARKVKRAKLPAPSYQDKSNTPGNLKLRTASVSNGSEGEPAIAEALAGPAAATVASPSPSAGFAGALDTGDHKFPDAQGAVGQNWIVVFVNKQMRILDKTGGVLRSVTLNEFWSPVGASNAVACRVTFDPYGRRFIACAVATKNRQEGLVVGVTQTGDPTGAWNLYFHPEVGVFPDSPNLGFSRNRIVVQANVYDEADNYLGSQIYAYNKTNLYAGLAGTRTDLGLQTDLGDSHVPALTFDASLGTNYLLNVWGGNYPEQDPQNPAITNYNGYLRLYTITGNPGFEEFTPGGFIQLFNGSWEKSSPNDINFAPQPGTANKIYLGDDRLYNLTYRNGTLWTAHTVFPSDTGTSPPTRSEVQWLEILPGTAPTGIQGGRVGDGANQVFYAFPSIAVNTNNDVVVAYNAFSAAEFPRIEYRFRADVDQFSNLRDPITLKNSDASFLTNSSWGTLNAAAVDASNDSDLWVLQEYASNRVGGADRWGAWWGRVAPPADLRLTMVASSNSLPAGGSLTYTITVTNQTVNRLTTASGVRVIDTLPPSANYLLASSTQGSCTFSNGVVTCDLGNMPIRSRATVTITVSTTTPGTISNQAQVVFNGEDTDPGDNSASINTTVTPSSDVSVLVAESADPVTVGEDIFYIVTVSNKGPSGATGVLLTNTLPANSVFLDASTSQGTITTNGNMVRCNIGSLNVGAIVDVVIQARATLAGQATNRATVFSTSVDLSKANNAASVVTTFNARPTISAIANRTIAEDGSAVVAFTVGDRETAAGSLVVTASSDNQLLVPNANITPGGANSNRNVTITPASNLHGSATITVTVTDAHGASGVDSFLLTVVPVNDPPTLTPLSTVNVDEDSGPATVNLAGISSGPPNESDTLTITAVSSQPAIIPTPQINYTSPNGTGSLIFTPATNAHGSVNITVTVNDNRGSNNTVSQVFTVNVQQINDPPAVNPVADISIAEDAPLQTINLTGISSGPNETQTISISAASDNPSLIPAPQVVYTSPNSTGSIRFTPAAGQSGTARITLSVNDGAGAGNSIVSNSFLVTVFAVNDPPTVDALSNLNLAEDAAAQTVNLTGIGSGASNESDTIQITATSSNPSLIPDPVVSYTSPNTTGSLGFTPVPNASGSATITVNLNDGRGSNNVTTRTFTVAVAAVNDQPTLDLISDVNLNEDAAPLTINLSGIASGAANETQTLTVTASSSAPGALPNPSIAYTNGNSTAVLTLAPTANSNGTVNVTVTVNDGAPSNNIVTRTFSVTISPINDPPVLNVVNDLTINEDAGLQTVSLNGVAPGPPNETESVIISATSSATGLIPDPTVSYQAGNATGSLSFTPVANQFGSATITVTLNDGQGANNTFSRTFTVTVNPVNDPPTINTVNNVTINEDAPQQTVNLSGIGSGAPNETNTITVTASSSAPSIVPNPTVLYTNGNPTAVLRYTPVPNSNGVVTITVAVNDGGAANNITTTNFNITIRPINDPPSLAGLDNQEILEDTSVTFNFTVSDLETNAANITLRAESFNEELITTNGITFGGSGGSRTLTLRPVTNQFGDSVFISVIATDPEGASTEVFFSLKVTAVNDAPLISAISNQSINEDTPSGIINYNIEDVDNNINELTVSVTSSNQTLIPNANIVPGGSGNARTLVITPALNQFGSTTVSVRVSDGTTNATRSFQVVVNAVNDRPTLGALGDLNINEDASQQIVSLSNITDGAGNEADTLTVTATSSNPSLIPNPTVFYTNTATGAIRFTPVANANGTATITVTVNDNVASNNIVSQSFSVTVQAINDPPTLDAIANLSLPEDAPLQTVNLTGISSGPANESPAVTINASHNAPGLIANLNVNYTSGASGNLTFNTVPNVSGSATVTVTVDDGAGSNNTFTRTFTVTVFAVNDTPTIASINNVTVAEDSGATTVNLSGITSGAANESQTLVVTASSSQPSVVPNPAITYTSPNATGSLVFTPAANATGSVVMTVTVNDGGGSNNIATAAFTINITPINDLPTIAAVSDVVTNEDRTVTITLNASDVETPAAALTLSATSSNTGVVPLSGLSFVNQTLTIRPGTNASGSTLITVTVQDAQGASVSTSFTATFNAVNDLPEIQAITNQSTPEDTPTSAITFTVQDAEDSANQLVVSGVSSNATLVPQSNLVFGGSGGARTLTITPAPGLSGTAGIRINVVDLNGGSNSTSFVLTVVAVNDPPTISSLANQTILEDGVLGPVSFTIDDPETAAGTLTVTRSSGNTTLLPLANVVLGGSGANRTVTATPAANLSGSSIITLTVSDGTNSVSSAFSLTVTSINDPPTLTALSNMTIGEDAPAQTVNLSGIGPGAPNESQGLSVTATSSNPALIPDPSVNYANGNTTGSITFAPAAQASGSAVITVTVRETTPSPLSFSRQFTVTVTNINDAPVLTGIESRTTAEDTPISFTINVGDIETDPSRLILSATSGNATLLPNTGILFDGYAAARTVILVPAANQNGSGTVTITLSDGTASVSSNFTLTVTAVNDPPTFNPLPTFSTLENVTSTLTITGVSPGAANEGQTVAFTVSNNNSSLFATQPSINYTNPGANAFLTFKTARNITGTAIVTITANDGVTTLVRTVSINCRANANANPTLTGLANVTVNEDTPGSRAFTIGDTTTPVDLLSLAAISSNPALLPTNGISFIGSGATRTVTFTPLPNQSGTSTVSITVTDTNLGATTSNLLFIVNAVADRPVISAIPNQTTGVGSSVGPVPFTVSDAEVAAGSLNVTASSSNPTLIPNANVLLGGNGTNRSFILVPASGQAGTSTITLTVSDGANTASTNFTLTVDSAPPPAIAIQLGVNQVTVSWPNVGVYVLQQRANMNPGQPWTDTGITPTLINGRWQATINTTPGPAGYYRLRR